MYDWIFYADSVMLTTFTSPIRASLTFMFSQGLLLTFSQPGCLEMHGELFAVLEKFLLDKYLKFTKLICLLSMLNLFVWMLVRTTAEQILEGCLGNFYSSKASGKSVSTKGKNLLVLKRRESKAIV